MFFLAFIWSLPNGILLFWVHYWTKSGPETSDNKTQSLTEPLVLESFPVGLIECKLYKPFIFSHCFTGFPSHGKCCSLCSPLPDFRDLLWSFHTKINGATLFETQSLPTPGVSKIPTPGAQKQKLLTPRFYLSSSLALIMPKPFFKEGYYTCNPRNISMSSVTTNSCLTVSETWHRIKD